MRLGAVVLALLTLSAIVFAYLNFQQRSRFILPDDGVTWLDAQQGVVAWHVVADSPAAKAGIKEGDVVTAVRGIPVHRATDVTRILFHAGPWTEVRYQMHRGGAGFETPLVTAPQDSSSSIENYLRITALLYIFIGLFIFVRRWNAPRAVHFYIFCLVSFILYSFHYTGKLNSFDTTIYWTQSVAWFLQPALLVHFALVFPERRGTLWLKLVALYSLPLALLALQVFVATGTLDFLPSIESRNFLDTLDLFYLGIYFMIAAGIFLASYFRAPSGVLRQQLKWVTGGTIAGIVPFFLFYVLPRTESWVPQPWMKLSVFSLALIPLCFGYAIIRYRLMDVDIIFKRGLAYTFATAAIVGIYFAGIALIGETFHTRWPTGPAGGVIAIVVAAFLFEQKRRHHNRYHATGRPCRPSRVECLANERDAREINSYNGCCSKCVSKSALENDVHVHQPVADDGVTETEGDQSQREDREFHPRLRNPAFRTRQHVKQEKGNDARDGSACDPFQLLAQYAARSPEITSQKNSRGDHEVNAEVEKI